jgi:hypothetical protein
VRIFSLAACTTLSTGLKPGIMTAKPISTAGATANMAILVTLFIKNAPSLSAAEESRIPGNA